MFFPLVAFVASALTTNHAPADNNLEAILGHWKGIELFQDESSYDGRTFYLPNSEEIIIDKNRVRVYFYPYFKSDEFEAALTAKSIIYTIGKRRVKSEYQLQGDTLTLKMYFINKVFVKKYKRVTLDQDVVDELDKYGFNPSAVTFEFELDTLHKNFLKGFNSFGELSFEPVNHIQFMSDNTMRLNRGEAIPFERQYQKIWYSVDTTLHEFEIYDIRGSQQFSIIPKTLCQCDSIILPYIVVSWGDRIRKQIVEDTW